MEAIDVDSYIRTSLNVEQRESLLALQHWVIENSLDLRLFYTFYIHPALPLLAYLRYNDFDIDTSISQILGNVKRRELDDIGGYHLRSPESILNCSAPQLSAFRQIYPQWHCSFNRSGQPVVYKQLARFVVADLLSLVNTGALPTSRITARQRLINMHLWEHEICAKLCYQQTVSLQRIVDQSVFVYDLNGMSLSQIRSEVFSYLHDTLFSAQRLYPSAIGAVYMINVPAGFSAMWQLFSLSWLDKQLQARVQIFGPAKQWLPVLETTIGLENMPENYGGSLQELTESTPQFAEYLYKEPPACTSVYDSEAEAAEAEAEATRRASADISADSAIQFIQKRRLRQKHTHISNFQKSLHTGSDSGSSDEERARTRVNTLKNELICRQPEVTGSTKAGQRAKSPLARLFGEVDADSTPPDPESTVSAGPEVGRTPTPSRLRFNLERPLVIGVDSEAGGPALSAGVAVWSSDSSGSSADHPVRVPRRRTPSHKHRVSTPNPKPRAGLGSPDRKAEGDVAGVGGVGGSGTNEWEAELGFLKELSRDGGRGSRGQLGLGGGLPRAGSGARAGRRSFLRRQGDGGGVLAAMRRRLRQNSSTHSVASSETFGISDGDADSEGGGVVSPRAAFPRSGDEGYSQTVWEAVAKDGGIFDRPTIVSRRLVENFSLVVLRQYLGLAIAFYMCVNIGSMVLSVYAIVRTSYVSASVTLQTWSSVVVLLMSIFLLAVNLVGYVGLRYKNRALLIMYSLCLTTAVCMFSLVALGAGLYSAGIGGYNSSINDRISTRAAEAVRAYNFALAMMCASAAVCGVIPMVFSSAVILKLKLEQYTQQRQLFSGVMRISELRVVLKVAVLIAAVVALVMIVYGATVIEQLASTTLSLVLFSVFGLVYGGVALAIATAFAWWVALTNHKGVVRAYCRVVVPGMMVINAFSSVVAFVTLGQNYKLTNKEFADSSSSDSFEVTKAYVVTSLLVTGVLLLFAASFQTIPLITSHYLLESLARLNEDQRDNRLPIMPVDIKTEPSPRGSLWGTLLAIGTGAAASTSADADALHEPWQWNAVEYAAFTTHGRTSTEILLVVWGTLMGLAELFFNGTFVIFSKFISNGGIIGFLYSFLGTVDKRYITEDPLVVSSSAIMSIVVGPGLLLYAWATFVKAPSRHTIAMVCCTMQIYTMLLQYAVEIALKFEGMSGANVGVLVAVLVVLVLFRVVLPSCVFIYEAKQAARAAAAFDTLAYNQWARGLNTSRPKPLVRQNSSQHVASDGWVVRPKPRSITTSIAVASSIDSADVPGPFGEGDEWEEPDSGGSSAEAEVAPIRSPGLCASDITRNASQQRQQYTGGWSRGSSNGSGEGNGNGDGAHGEGSIDEYRSCSSGGTQREDNDVRVAETPYIAQYYNYFASYLPGLGLVPMGTDASNSPVPGSKAPPVTPASTSGDIEVPTYRLLTSGRLLQCSVDTDDSDSGAPSPLPSPLPSRFPLLARDDSASSVPADGLDFMLRLKKAPSHA